MFTFYHTHGLILKKSNRQEADQLLITYTQNFGRLEIVARGIRKITSKLRPAIEFPALIDLEFIQGKTCKTLTDAVILIPLRHLLFDVYSQNVVYRILAITEALIPDQQTDDQVWDLILTTLLRLDNNHSQTPAIYQYFIWHLFGILGWRPEFPQNSIERDCNSLIRYFRDSDIDHSAQIRLTRRQITKLEDITQNYLALITK